MRRMAARTGNRPVVLIGRIILQQLRQRSSPSLVHSGSQSDLHRFQVEPAVVTPLLKSNPQEPVYFTDNFLAACLRRFFSCAVCWVSSTGRKRSEEHTSELQSLRH